ncbi:hypothetical protein CQY20_01985 [Mycolicibacterium agri]|uniref:Septum formation-related domain-containing protein n=1 Tax=Mycolicibacterium agri TaxID=36811 RepID=A0A2A7NFZ4_MYCAG|nr:septum formation family protein [Mycolicibacterium agri]PEG42780.1 hypothetical protein CQY20_01985 [Mycolicibacterium agri]GFG52776.1 hypothetical protein MAGR_42170 [Mycolicibacterium agri]
MTTPPGPQYPPGPYQPGQYPPPGPYYPPPGYPPGPYPPPGGYQPPRPPGTNWWLIAGLVLAGLLVLVLVVGIVLYLAFGRGTVAANKVAVGDCLKELPDSGRVLAVDTVDCQEQHTGEVFAVITMPDGDFPGQFLIEQYQNKCGPELAKYSPEAASDPEVGLFVLYPSKDSWDEGDRTVTCIATTDTPRTGHLEK